MGINFRNTTENLLITIVVMALSGLLGGVIGYKSAIGAIEAQQPIIQQAIEKNTSEISNTFSNEFKKIKNKKGEPINIVIDPSTNSVITSDTNQVVTVEEKKGFFKRLFKKD